MGGPGACMGPYSRGPTRFYQKNTRFVGYGGGAGGGGALESTKTRFIASKLTFFWRSHTDCRQKGRPPHGPPMTKYVIFEKILSYVGANKKIISISYF